MSQPASSPGSSGAIAPPAIDGTWVVTGAARGLGLCLTRVLSGRGARVLALSRQGGPLTGLPGVRHLPYDQASPASIAGIGAALAGERIDAVIHNAAIRGDTGGLAGLAGPDLLEVMRINVAGPLLLTRALLPLLAPEAVLAFVSSRAGSFSEGHDPEGDYAYCLSKAALNRAVAKLADDLPFRVLALHPGWIATDMGGPDAPESPDLAAARILALLTSPDGPKTGSFTDADGRTIAP